MALFTPPIARELLRECRHRIHFVGRVVFVVAVVAFALLSVSRTPSAPRGLGRVGTPGLREAVSLTGLALFTIWAWGQYAALTLFSTVRAARLADERRTGSLALLRISRIGDAGAVLGTFLSVMARAAFTLVLAVPLLVLAQGMGGFKLDQVLWVALFTVAAALTAAALSILVAAVTTGTGAAVSLSIVAQVVWLVVTGIIIDVTYIADLCWLNPVTLVARTIENTTIAPEDTRVFLALAIGSAVLFLLAAFRLLRGGAWRPGRVVKRAFHTADRFFLRITPRRAILWRGGLGRCRGNPVLWRERAASLIGRPDHMIRFVYSGLILFILALLVLHFTADPDVVVQISVAGLVAVPLLVFALFLIVNPATTFVRERQNRSLELLAVTPMTARTILAGKFRFCLRPIWIPIGLIVLVVGLALAVGTEMEPQGYVVIVSLFALAPLVAALTLFVGAGARSSAAAIMAGAVFLIGAGLLWWDVEGEMYQEFLPYELSDLPTPFCNLLAMAFALVCACAAGRARWLGNVGSLVVGTVLLLFLGDYVPMMMAPYVAAAACLLACAYLAWCVQKRLILALPVLVAACIFFWNDLPPLMLRLLDFTDVGLLLVLVVALARFAVFCRRSVLNRAVIALSVFMMLNVLGGLAAHEIAPAAYDMLSWSDSMNETAMCLSFGATGLAALLTAALFVWLTTRQLDRLIGRHG